MNYQNYQGLRNKLDTFSRRLDAKVREFKDQGEFSDDHEPVVEQIRKRHKCIREDLDAAIRKGAVWETIKYEFERDFNALHEELLRFEDRLDANVSKREAATLASELK